MIVINCEQRSQAWFDARLGRVTGSKVGLLSAELKSGKEPAGRRDYRTQLALERVTCQLQEPSFVNDDMKRGIELEPAAFAAYSVLTGEWPMPLGFAQHETLMAGTSPDGIIGGSHDPVGALELKCPRPANHLAYLKAKTLPAEHKAQVVHACWITGARWVDFLSYCPAMPPKLQTFLVRYQRNEAEMAAHELIVRQFLREVEKEVAEIQALQGVA